MTGDKNWFTEFQSLSNDEKEIYNEFILDSEKRAIVFDYERFKSAVELIASKPNDLLIKYNEKLNIAEEVALTFDNECIYIVSYLKKEKCISDEIFNLVMQINEQLELLSDEYNEKNWTIQAMECDSRWIKARELAKKLLDVQIY